MKGEVSQEESTGKMRQAGKEVATRESLDREREMIVRINRGVGQFQRLGGEHEFAASALLRPEQKQAIEFVLNSHDLAVNIRGAAGTGKTATFQNLHPAPKTTPPELLPRPPPLTPLEH